MQTGPFFSPNVNTSALLFKAFLITENASNLPPIRTPRTRRSFRCLLRSGYIFTAIPLNASDFRGINRNQTQNAVLVDLCSGHPKQTDAARCLTARYGQTTLSNRKGERSGVLLIKEATKKGYKEALPGDTVDLGYAGSNTRRGRVGCDIAHTLETSCIQGIVENGGRIRRLMPRECLRLQGFEEWQIDRILAIQSDAQAYKQAGNSVTVNVIEAIAKRIRTVDEELKAGAAA